MASVSLAAPLQTVFQLLGNRPPGDLTTLTRTQRALLVVSSLLAALVLSALWGLAATSTSMTASLGNVVKVPTLLVGSGLAALPLVCVLWKLVGPTEARLSGMMLAYASALFGGTLLLAVMAPLVAIYQHSSTLAGPPVALGSAVVAVLGFAFLFWRTLRRVAGGADVGKLAVPAIVLIVVQGLALSQLAAATTPVFRERTTFGQGVDAWQSHPGSR